MRVYMLYLNRSYPGRAQEIAAACIFLCLNNYITGQILPVDGGEWCPGPNFPHNMCAPARIIFFAA